MADDVKIKLQGSILSSLASQNSSSAQYTSSALPQSLVATEALLPAKTSSMDNTRVVTALGVIANKMEQGFSQTISTVSKLEIAVTSRLESINRQLEILNKTMNLVHADTLKYSKQTSTKNLRLAERFAPELMFNYFEKMYSRFAGNINVNAVNIAIIKLFSNQNFMRRVFGVRSFITQQRMRQRTLTDELYFTLMHLPKNMFEASEDIINVLNGLIKQIYNLSNIAIKRLIQINDDLIYGFRRLTYTMYDLYKQNIEYNQQYVLPFFELLITSRFQNLRELFSLKYSEMLDVKKHAYNIQMKQLQSSIQTNVLLDKILEYINPVRALLTQDQFKQHTYSQNILPDKNRIKQRYEITQQKTYEKQEKESRNTNILIKYAELLNAYNNVQYAEFQKFRKDNENVNTKKIKEILEKKRKSDKTENKKLKDKNTITVQLIEQNKKTNENLNQLYKETRFSNIGRDKWQRKSLQAYEKQYTAILSTRDAIITVVSEGILKLKGIFFKIIKYWGMYHLLSGLIKKTVLFLTPKSDDGLYASIISGISSAFKGINLTFSNTMTRFFTYILPQHLHNTFFQTSKSIIDTIMHYINKTVNPHYTKDNQNRSVFFTKLSDIILSSLMTFGEKFLLPVVTSLIAIRTLWGGTKKISSMLQQKPEVDEHGLPIVKEQRGLKDIFSKTSQKWTNWKQKRKQPTTNLGNLQLSKEIMGGQISEDDLLNYYNSHASTYVGLPQQKKAIQYQLRQLKKQAKYGNVQYKNKQELLRGIHKETDDYSDWIMNTGRVGKNQLDYGDANRYDEAYKRDKADKQYILQKKQKEIQAAQQKYLDTTLDVQKKSNRWLNTKARFLDFIPGQAAEYKAYELRKKASEEGLEAARTTQTIQGHLKEITVGAGRSIKQGAINIKDFTKLVGGSIFNIFKTGLKWIGKGLKWGAMIYSVGKLFVNYIPQLFKFLLGEKKTKEIIKTAESEKDKKSLWKYIFAQITEGIKGYIANAILWVKTNKTEIWDTIIGTFTGIINMVGDLLIEFGQDLWLHSKLVVQKAFNAIGLVADESVSETLLEIRKRDEELRELVEKRNKDIAKNKDTIPTNEERSATTYLGATEKLNSGFSSFIEQLKEATTSLQNISDVNTKVGQNFASVTGSLIGKLFGNRKGLEILKEAKKYATEKGWDDVVSFLDYSEQSLVDVIKENTKREAENVAKNAISAQTMKDASTIMLSAAEIAKQARIKDYEKIIYQTHGITATTPEEQKWLKSIVDLEEDRFNLIVNKDLNTEQSLEIVGRILEKRWYRTDKSFSDVWDEKISKQYAEGLIEDIVERIEKQIEHKKSQESSVFADSLRILAHEKNPNVHMQRHWLSTISKENIARIETNPIFKTLTTNAEEWAKLNNHFKTISPEEDLIYNANFLTALLKDYERAKIDYETNHGFGILGLANLSFDSFIKDKKIEDFYKYMKPEGGPLYKNAGQMALDALALNETSVSAETQELIGIQNLIQQYGVDNIVDLQNKIQRYGGPLYKNAGGEDETFSTIGNVLSVFATASITKNIQDLVLGIMGLTGLFGNKNKVVDAILPGGKLVSGFGDRIDPITKTLAFHSGIDIKAKMGTKIPAIDEGKMIYAGYNKDYGNYMITKYNNFEPYFRYSHLKEAPKLALKQNFNRGDTLGLVGDTGRSTGPHLHLELIKHTINENMLKNKKILNRDNFIDPITFLNKEFTRQEMMDDKKLIEEYGSGGPLISNTNNIADHVKRMIKNHEGLRLERYICSTGHPTIGYGHTGKYVQKGRISQAEADQIFEEDFIKYSSLAQRIPEYMGLDVARRGALIDLVYNLGYGGFMGFKKTREALAQKNWGVAASELLNSKYAKQVGRRAQTIANIFRTGQLGSMPPAVSSESGTSTIASNIDSIQGVATPPIDIASTGSNIIANIIRGPGRITSKFGMRTHPTKHTQKLHKGIDIAASAGTPIISPWPGKVIINKNNPNGYGWYVVVDHGNFATLYGHMISQSPLAIGSQVSTGDILGMVGSTGASTGPHVHFEVRPGGGNFFNRGPVDPLTFAGASLPTSAMDAVDAAAQEMTEQSNITAPTVSVDAFKNNILNSLSNLLNLMFTSTITPLETAAYETPTTQQQMLPSIIPQELDPVNARFNQLIHQYGLASPLDGVGGGFDSSINFGRANTNLLNRAIGLSTKIPMIKTLSSLEDQDYLANILQNTISPVNSDNSSTKNVLNSSQPNIIVINQNPSTTNVSNQASNLTQTSQAGTAKSAENIFGTW